ncbi:MAG TPA: FAD-dependent oxidoreductase [Thermomicrobiales bacterium]|nr:FAD-dependent oxidoreductase [Thermomicrobiales bacterium]
MDLTARYTTRTLPAGAGLDDLVARLRGEVIRPGDPTYNDARAVWNAAIDRRPAGIVRAAGAADVRTALAFAHTRGLPLAVRGGGHHVAGLGTVDGGLVLDLGGMRAISVDRVARTAWVGAGTRLRDLDRATQVFGLAVPAGQISDTGVAGLTLGGGTGWLMRRHGLTIDNLLAVELVTADGRVLRASEDDHADLFWGVRGGGGNFGVVTAFQYRLHPVGPIVLGGPILHTLDRAGAALRAYRDFMAGAPDELTAFAVFTTVPAGPPFPRTCTAGGSWRSTSATPGRSKRASGSSPRCASTARPRSTSSARSPTSCARTCSTAPHRAACTTTTRAATCGRWPTRRSTRW